MRINNLVVVMLGFLLLAGSAMAGPAQVPTGFRDLVWGASPDKKLKKHPGSPATGDIAIYQRRSGKHPPSLFKVPVAEEAYSFLKGRFFQGNAWVDGRANYRKLLTVLTRKYGQPAQTDERRNVTKWKWPDSPVEVLLAYDQEFDRATVTYVNQGLIASAPTEAKAASEAAQ